MTQDAIYMPTLETARLILRKMIIADAEAVFEYAANPDVSRYTSWKPHSSVENSVNFINGVLTKYENQEPANWGIVEKRSGKFIGTCGFVYIHAGHSRAEIGYVLAKEYWGKGMMTEAVREVIRYGFHELALNRIEARADVRNIASWRVMGKANMSFEGVLRQHIFIKGEYHDLKMYSILRVDFEG